MATSAFDARSFAQIKTLSGEVAVAAAILYLVGRHLGLQVIVVEGRRDLERQRRLVSEGASQTLKSKHLEGLAFDVAFQGVGYEVPLVYWHILGAIGEWLGLTWGGRWASLRDYGHFEAPSASYTLPNRVWA